MSICRTVLRGHAIGETNPAEVLRKVNRVMSPDIGEDMFVCMLYCVLNTKTRELTIARAGHERPIRVSTHEEGFEVIDSAGIAIGISDPDAFDHILEERRMQLKPGDVLAFYTDGVTEAMNAKQEEWGVDNLLTSLQISASEGASSVLTNVKQRLLRFVGDTPQYDDMTLLALHAVEQPH